MGNTLTTMQDNLRGEREKAERRSVHRSLNENDMKTSVQHDWEDNRAATFQMSAQDWNQEPKVKSFATPAPGTRALFPKYH